MKLCTRLRDRNASHNALCSTRALAAYVAAGGCVRGDAGPQDAFWPRLVGRGDLIACSSHHADGGCHDVGEASASPGGTGAPSRCARAVSRAKLRRATIRVRLGGTV
jgi:hypothetical protein